MSNDRPITGPTTPVATRRGGPLAAAHLLATAAFVLALAWFELSSVDIGYHVAYGQRTLASGHVVDVDPFIYGAKDHAFVNANWLTQVVMAWLFDRFDWVGLFALRVALIAVTFTCIAGAMRAAGAGPHTIAWAWLAAALGMYERFSMRPELFSYAILAAQLWLLMRGPQRRGTLAGVTLLQAAWVNLHSYFLLGPLVTAAMAAGAWIVGRWPGGGQRPAARSRWGLLLLLQIAACFANPWHVDGAVFPIKTLGYLRSEKVMAQAPADPVQSPWGVISEFQSPFGFFKFLGASRTTYAYATLLALAAAGLIAAIARRRFDWMLVILLISLVSMQMRRNVALLGLIGAPVALAALSMRPSTLRTSPRSADRYRAPRTAAVLVTLGFVGYWLVGIWTGQFFFSERRPARRLAAGWAEEIFPHAAVRWLNAHPAVRPRLFTDLMTSSNVLPWLRSDMQVFITTNTFAYPAEQLMRCWNVGIGREDYHAFFAEYGVHVVLLRAHPPTEPLIRALARDGDWALVHMDMTYVIFLRRIPEHAAIIAAETRDAGQLDSAQWLADAPRPHAVIAYRLGSMASVPFCLGWYDRAKPLLEEAVRQEPGYFEAWNNLGICHVEMGKRLLAQTRKWDAAQPEFQAGLQCFENILKLDPGNAEARINRDQTPVGVER